MVINLSHLSKVSIPTLLFRAAIILAIIIFDILLGIKAKVDLLIPVVMLVGGAIFFFVLFRRIEWGLLLLVPASFFGRWNISTGTNVAFNLTILLCIFVLVIWLLRMILFDHQVILVPSEINRPAIAFILVATLSLIVGNNQWIPQASGKANLFAQLGGWLLYVLSIGVLLLPGNLIKDLRLMRIVVWQFLILAIIFISTSLIPITAPYVNKVFVNPTYFGSTFWIWASAFAASILILQGKADRKKAVLMLILLAAIFYRGWFIHREWISGWGPPLVAIATVLWLRNWRLAMTLFVVVGLIVGVHFSNLSSSVMTETQQYSAYSRTATWPILLELFKANPIFGLGPANYYYYTPLFSLLGWYVRFNSHNNYIDIVMQYGVLGLIAFCWLIYEIVRLAWRLRSTVEDEFSRVYIYACIGGLAGMLASGLLGDWFLPFLYNISTGGFRFSVVNWLFLGGLVVIEQIEASKQL